MRDGEGGDDAEQRTEPPAAQHQREQEQDVVVAGQDMLDAEAEEGERALLCADPLPARRPLGRDDEAGFR